ncbi:hypothetical protein T09_730 [Trichinella sp. T9]|nr:hypothetical protein T09_730 [Trichinella sp. T9]
MKPVFAAGNPGTVCTIHAAESALVASIITPEI